MFSVKILTHIFLISFWQAIRIERSRQKELILHECTTNTVTVNELSHYKNYIYYNIITRNEKKKISIVT